MKTFLILLAIAVALFVVDRLLLRAETRGWIYYRRSRGRSGSSASAFLEIQSMLEPSRKHVIEARSEAKEEEDDAGEPPGDEDPERPKGGGR